MQILGKVCDVSSCNLLLWSKNIEPEILEITTSKITWVLHYSEQEHNILTWFSSYEGMHNPVTQFKENCYPNLLISTRRVVAEKMLSTFKVARAWRETTPICSGLTRLVCAGYSHHYSGASGKRARIMRHAQNGSVHMQLVSRPALSRPVDFNVNKYMYGYEKLGRKCLIFSYWLKTCRLHDYWTISNYVFTKLYP